MESKSSRERNCSEMEAVLVDGLLSLSASEMNGVWCFYSFLSVTTNPKNLGIRQWGMCGSAIVSF